MPQPDTEAAPDAVADDDYSQDADNDDEALFISDFTKLAAVSKTAARALEGYFDVRCEQLSAPSARSASAAGMGQRVASAHAMRAQGLASMAASGNLEVKSAESAVAVRSVAEGSAAVTVKAYERTRFVYDDLTDGVGGSDAAMFGTEHELVMEPDGKGSWSISTDAYDEQDVSGVDTTGASGVEDGAATALAPSEDAQPQSGTGSIGVQTAYADSAPVYSATYDPEKAITYSDQYALSYNSAYRNFNPVGGDCANFVSQCMNAGGFGQVVGKYSAATSWYYSSASNYSSSWVYCPTMVNCLKKRGLYVDVSTNSAANNGYGGPIFPGSPVIYKSSTVWSHATFCVGYNSAGVPIVNAHNSDRYHMPYTYWKPKARCTIQLTKVNYYGRTFSTTSADAATQTATGALKFTWVTTSPSTVALKSYTGSDKTVSVGTTVRDADNTSYTVTRIAEDAFSGSENAGNKSVKTLKVGDKVAQVGQSAFENCTALATVTLGASVNTVCSRAFRGCTALANVKGAQALIYAKTGAFYGCKKISALPTLPKLKSAGSSAFRNCTRLRTLPQLPALTSIGANAFRGCSSLASISGQPKLKTIGASSFRGCAALASIPALPALTTVKNYAFYNCDGLKTATLGSVKLTGIGTGAFGYADRLANVTIASPKLKKLPASAFSYCPALKKVTLSSTKLASIGKSAFRGCSKLKTLVIKSAKIAKKSKVGSKAFSGVNKKAKVKVPASKLKKYRKWFRAKGLPKKVKFAKV